MDLVELSKISKELKKLPLHIKRKLLEWAQAVELEGIKKVRKFKGFHDEPLKGRLKGRRSIRLSKAYRAIYVEAKNGTINLIIVEKVNKHEY